MQLNSPKAQAPVRMRMAADRFASPVVWIVVRQKNGPPKVVRADAFSSVSLDPPIVLWSVNLASLKDIRLEVDQACGISILTSAQALSESSTDGCDTVCWEYGDAFGAPHVADAAACFEGVILKRIPCADHVLFLAQLGGFDHCASRTGALSYSGMICGAEQIATLS